MPSLSLSSFVSLGVFVSPVPLCDTRGDGEKVRGRQFLYTSTLFDYDFSFASVFTSEGGGDVASRVWKTLET